MQKRFLLICLFLGFVIKCLFVMKRHVFLNWLITTCWHIYVRIDVGLILVMMFLKHHYELMTNWWHTEWWIPYLGYDFRKLCTHCVWKKLQKCRKQWVLLHRKFPRNLLDRSGGRHWAFMLMNTNFVYNKLFTIEYNVGKNQEW